MIAVREYNLYTAPVKHNQLENNKLDEERKGKKKETPSKRSLRVTHPEQDLHKSQRASLPYQSDTERQIQSFGRHSTIQLHKLSLLPVWIPQIAGQKPQSGQFAPNRIFRIRISLFRPGCASCDRFWAYHQLVKTIESNTSRWDIHWHAKHCISSERSCFKTSSKEYILRVDFVHSIEVVYKTKVENKIGHYTFTSGETYYPRTDTFDA